MLAGIPVSGEFVRRLAACVDEPTASYLTLAVEAGRSVVALTIEDRERIIRALGDRPDGLAELRGVLLREHEWRVREGLV
jgi:hypothetical protein